MDWDYCRDRLGDVYDMCKVLIKKREDKLNEWIFKFIERDKHKNPLNEINTHLAIIYRQRFEDFFLSEENVIPLN